MRQNNFKTPSWRLSGTTFDLEARNASKQFSRSLLLKMGSESLKNNVLEGFWTYFWASSQKCFKTTLKQLPGGLLELLFGLRTKMFQHSPWRLPGPPLLSLGPEILGSLVELLLSAGLEMLQNSVLEARIRVWSEMTFWLSWSCVYMCAWWFPYATGE